MKWCTISSLNSPKRSIYCILYLHLPLNYLSFQSRSMIHWVSGTIDLSLFIKPPTNPGSTKAIFRSGFGTICGNLFPNKSPFSSAFFWLQNPPFRHHTSPVTESSTNWVRKCIKGFWNGRIFPPLCTIMCVWWKMATKGWWWFLIHPNWKILCNDFKYYIIYIYRYVIFPKYIGRGKKENIETTLKPPAM